jgi:hypothetical protein
MGWRVVIELYEIGQDMQVDRVWAFQAYGRAVPGRFSLHRRFPSKGIFMVLPEFSGVF